MVHPGSGAFPRKLWVLCKNTSWMECQSITGHHTHTFTPRAIIANPPVFWGDFLFVCFFFETKEETRERATLHIKSSPSLGSNDRPWICRAATLPDSNTHTINCLFRKKCWHFLLPLNNVYVFHHGNLILTTEISIAFLGRIGGHCWNLSRPQLFEHRNVWLNSD